LEADKDGHVSINSVEGKDPSEMSSDQKTFFNVVNSAIKGEGMATINIVNNSSDIIIADANDKKIDIGDVNAIGEGAYINKYSVLAHETYEAYNYQAKNIPLKNAHLNASGIERLMTGSYIDPLEREINANGISNIPIRNANNVIIHNIIIHTANGNIKKVSR